MRFRIGDRVRARRTDCVGVVTDVDECGQYVKVRWDFVPYSLIVPRSEIEPETAAELRRLREAIETIAGWDETDSAKECVAIANEVLGLKK